MELKEYWRWPEGRWTDPDLDWKKASIITAGIDVGSVSSKAMIMLDGEKLFANSLMRTGSGSQDSAQRALNRAMEGTGMTQKDIHYIVGTGYGRLNIPFANKAITEIACHGRGANFVYGPTVRTVLDMGGQDCKAIRIDEQGKVKVFLMNDKCAAGTGRGMEVFADLIGVPIQDIGDLSMQIEEEPPPVSSTCVIFAKAEVTGLIESGWPMGKVAAAYCSAMAHRIYGLLERLGIEKDFAITGGISKNKGVISRLEKELGMKALPVKFDPQLAGAIGGALFAYGLAQKLGKAKS